jgi:hypothetical protein
MLGFDVKPAGRELRFLNGSHGCRQALEGAGEKPEPDENLQGRTGHGSNHDETGSEEPSQYAEPSKTPPVTTFPDRLGAAEHRYQLWRYLHQIIL